MFLLPHVLHLSGSISTVKQLFWTKQTKKKTLEFSSFVLQQLPAFARQKKKKSINFSCRTVGVREGGCYCHHNIWKMLETLAEWIELRQNVKQIGGDFSHVL